MTAAYARTRHPPKARRRFLKIAGSGSVRCRAEASDRLDAVEGRLSVIEVVMEAHHGPLPRPAN